jgi:uncharacterized protein (DUF433 family)
MATLTNSSLLRNIKPVPPEHLVGDLIQPGHRFFGLIWINPKRLGGTPCFYGTRVPLKNLFDYIESGLALDQFLEDFEGVDREQAAGVIELARCGLIAELPKP